MSLSELRAQVGADRPGETTAARRSDVRTASAPAAQSPRVGAPLDVPELPDRRRVRASWMALISRWAIFAALLLVTAGVTYLYLFIQRNLGLFDSIASDVFTKSRAITSAADKAKSGEIAGSITYAPKTDRSQPSPTSSSAVAASPIAPTSAAKQRAAIANGVAGATSARSITSVPTLGTLPPPVTHTRPVGAQSIPPAPPARQETAARLQSTTATSAANEPLVAGPRAIVRQVHPSSGACTEAVAALGLCTPQAKIQGK